MADEDYQDYPESIDEEQIPRYKEISSPQLSNEIVHFLFDHREIMNEFEDELKGVERYIDEKGKIIIMKTTGEKMLNDYGIKILKARLKPLINKTTQLSNYRVDEIRNIIKFESHSINEILFTMSDAYELKEEYQKSIILIFERFAESALRRALNGEGHKTIMTQIRRVEQGSIQETQRRNPLLPWVKPKTEGY